MLEQEPPVINVEKLPNNRIEGFGNGPPPPPLPQTGSDYLWHAVSNASEVLTATEVQDTLSSWYESAKEQLNSMVDAIDETVDNIADALHEVTGEHTTGAQNRAGFQQVSMGSSPPILVAAGETSDTHWVDVVAGIGCSGSIDSFVAVVRARCRSSEEQAFVGDTLADHFLNEVDHEALQRWCIVLMAVARGELCHCSNRIKARCSVKLSKLTKVALCATSATDALAALREERPTIVSTPDADLIDLDPSTQPRLEAVTQLSVGSVVQAVWAGDGKTYPAQVDSVSKDVVVVNWSRPAVDSASTQRFVSDVGDDSTYRRLTPSDIVADPSNLSEDLLDFNEPAAPVVLGNAFRGTESLTGLETVQPFLDDLFGAPVDHSQAPQFKLLSR